MNKLNTRSTRYASLKSAVALTFFVVGLTAYGQWTSISNYPGIQTDGVLSLVIDGKAYLAGGLGTKAVYSFDEKTDTWTQKTDVGGTALRGWAVGFSIGKKGYLGGGANSSTLADDFWEYDPATDTWSQKADLTFGAWDGAYGCSVKGKGYLIGGYDGTHAKSDVHEYDPSQDKWIKKTSYPGGQAIFPSGFVINDTIYVGLGSANGATGSKLFYRYDPVNDKWDKMADFVGTRRSACVGFSLNGKGYIIGGQDSYSYTYSDIYEYNPKANMWTKLSGQDFPLGESTAWSTGFALNNNLYMGTGANFAGGSLNFSNKFFKLTMGPTAVEAGSSEKYRIVAYPNPSRGEFRLSIPEGVKVKTIEIVDVSGRSVYFDDFTNAQFPIRLAPGMYHILGRTNNKVFHSTISIVGD